MSKTKRPYFCQTDATGAAHKSKYFADIDEAREWLREHGGGTIKKKNAGVIRASGHGLGRVEFDPPLRVYAVVETVIA
jgi:hypothetical protein